MEIRAPGAQPQLCIPTQDATPAPGDRALQRLRGSSWPLPTSRSPGTVSYPMPGACSSVPDAHRPAVPATEFLSRSCRSTRGRGDLGSGATPPQPLVRVQRRMSRWLTCQAATVRNRSIRSVRRLLWPKPQTWPAETLAKTEQQEAACGIHLLTQSPFQNKRDKRETQISLKMLRHVPLEQKPKN